MMVRIVFSLNNFTGPVLTFYLLKFMFLTLTDMVDKTRSPESTLLQQPRHSIHKRCLTLHKERECKNAPETFEGKTRTENRKVIVRSSYFKNKSSNENNQEDKQEKLLSKDCLASDIHENAVPVSAHFGNSHFHGKLVKRKISPNDSDQEVCAFILCFSFWLDVML